MLLVEENERFADAASFRGSEFYRSFAFVSCPTALRQIRQAGKDLMIWKRSIAHDVVAELTELLLDEVDDLALTSPIDALGETLVDAMNDAGYPATPALQRDIIMLAKQHATIIGGSEVRIRLEVVETDACRKFHADYVKLRTITTYLGQGTQWMEAGPVDSMGAPDGSAIRQLEPGDVGIFKGRMWQETPTVLHRSPPIGGTDEQRLVLVIDPAPSKEELAIRLGGSRA